jgi:adenylate kinase
MVVLLLGQQGTGKSTLGLALSRELSGCFISGGVLIRREIANRTEIGLAIKDQIADGERISPDLMYALLSREIEACGFEPLFLDGFPGSADEVGLLAEVVDRPDHALLLGKVPTDRLVQRLESREECGGCYATFSRGEFVRCPECAGPIEPRPEDSDVQRIARRHGHWAKTGGAIAAHYKAQGVLTHLDARLSPPQLLSAALAGIASGMEKSRT